MSVDILTSDEECIYKNIPCCPDTGADICVFPLSTFSSEQLASLGVYSPKFQANCANQSKLELNGCFDAKIRLSDASSPDILPTKIYLSPSVSQPLISYTMLVEFDLLPKNFPCVSLVQTDVSLDKKMNALFEEFKDVFCDEPEEPMDFPPLELHLKPQEEWNRARHPHQVSVVRGFHTHLAENAIKELERLLRLGVIERTSEPSAWCASSFFLPKPNGDVRLITDFSKLSEVLERPVHPFPCVQDILRSITAENKYFCSMDAKQGYFQLELHPNSRHLTTFITPIGRFRYRRLPIGMSASGDHWNLASDTALEGLPGIQKLVDDILTGAKNGHELYIRVRAVLLRCRATGMKLNRKKIQFGTKVEFAGHIISAQGVTPNHDKFDAILKFPTPTCVRDIQSFLGMANQLAIGLPDLSHAAKDLRLLLKKDIAFVWTEAQEASFKAIKNILTSSRVVSPYQIGKPTKLLTDASRNGLGYVLVQYDSLNSQQMKLVQCGSRSLIDAETRYSVTELELLGLVYAVKHCDHYLYHSPPFQIITDHRPLEGIFLKELHDLDGRILRLREKVLQYNFTVKWLEGKSNIMADALSRAPIFRPTSKEIAESEKLKLIYSVRAPAVEDLLLTKIVNAAKTDKEYNVLRKFVITFKQSQGSKRGTLIATLPRAHPAFPYKQKMNLISEMRNLLQIEHRIIVPKAYVSELLTNLHLGHPGKERMLSLARQNYTWSTMAEDIFRLVSSCVLCTKLLPSKPKDTNATIDIASGPMDMLGMDLFELNGTNYLIIVDIFSSYFFVKQLRSLITSAVLTHLSHILTRFGFCRMIVSDGGPQFRTEFQNFCTEHDIVHRTSSPYYPQANGSAEAAVKRAKYLMQKVTRNDELEMHILGCLSTPLSNNNRSPAELFFQRTIRLPGRPLLAMHKPVLTRMPAQHLEPIPSASTSFVPGERVVVQNKNKRWVLPGTIDSARRGGRSFYITMDDGSIILRNQRYIRPLSD